MADEKSQKENKNKLFQRQTEGQNITNCNRKEKPKNRKVMPWKEGSTVWLCCRLRGNRRPIPKLSVFFSQRDAGIELRETVSDLKMMDTSN